MKNFKKIFMIVFIIFIMVILGTNIYLSRLSKDKEGRPYRVEVSRITQYISENGYKRIDFKDYKYITNVEMLYNSDSQIKFFEGDNSDYLIKNIDGVYYRFDYIDNKNDYYKRMITAVNVSMSVMGFVIAVILLYVGIKLIKPFNIVRDMPYELSKGNLIKPVKENKSRFFGKFIWGLDLLRENLEEHKLKELKLQKEKKSLILCISHDIKTPLSAIKLYAKALSKNLYNTDERRIEIAESINSKADEIEGFVSEIVMATNEDFLDLSVKDGEFYLESLMEKVNDYYVDKLGFIKTDFTIEKYENCLIRGDSNRAIEVIQNIIENAIKYGDGKYIKIEINKEEDCRLITIINSGCNLLENELPHIFDSFWRGSNIGNNKGSGLGLYICRQLVYKMHGDIFAESVNGEMKVTIVFRMA